MTPSALTVQEQHMIRPTFETMMTLRIVELEMEAAKLRLELKELRIYQAHEDCASELCDQARQAILAGSQDTALALLNDIANRARRSMSHSDDEPNVEFSGTPAALSPEAPLERRVGVAVPPAPAFEGDRK